MTALIRFLQRSEDALLVLLLVAMLGLAILQIVLRNGFDSGISWADGAVRTLVLWVALVGSMIAVRRRQHIRIDALVRYAPAALIPWVLRLTDLVTAAICAAMAWYGLQLVRLEYSDGFTAFGSVPSWMAEAIIPGAFAVMALRYLLQTFIGPVVVPGPALARVPLSGTDDPDAQAP